MDPKVDDLLQKGLAEHRWDSVVEELRKSGAESGADPAANVLADQYGRLARGVRGGFLRALACRGACGRARRGRRDVAAGPVR